MAEDRKDAAVPDVVVNESHYHSKKDRVFVRAIQGHYNLKEELARLRSMPRVRKGIERPFLTRDCARCRA